MLDKPDPSISMCSSHTALTLALDQHRLKMQQAAHFPPPHCHLHAPNCERMSFKAHLVITESHGTCRSVIMIKAVLSCSCCSSAQATIERCSQQHSNCNCCEFGAILKWHLVATSKLRALHRRPPVRHQIHMLTSGAHTLMKCAAIHLA